MRYLYTICLALLLPLLWLMLCWRYRGTDYNSRWRERFGVVTADTNLPFLWLHTASVGEVVAARKLIDRLINDYPQYRLLITTTTPSGAKQVNDLFASKVRHCYLPYDLPYCIARFLKTFRPVALLIMETEMWPNMLATCYQFHVPSLLINARMSERSYSAYRRVACLSESMFSQLTAVVAQTTADAERLQQLGADNITVSGNIKIDMEVTADCRQQAKILAARWSNQGKRPVFIAASTHRGEDEQLLSVLQMLKRSQPQLLLVLVPRHPQRFDKVEQLCLQRGYRVCRHSKGAVDEDTDIIIGDTIGELMTMYGASDIAFVGGSLIDNGGHNILEPAAWGLPIVTGPSVYNFTAIVDGLTAVEGICVVEDNQQLAEKLTLLLNDSAKRHQMGLAAHQYVASNKGALQKLFCSIQSILDTIPKSPQKKYNDG